MGFESTLTALRRVATFRYMELWEASPTAYALSLNGDIDMKQIKVLVQVSQRHKEQVDFSVPRRQTSDHIDH